MYQLSLQQPCKISATASVIENRLRHYFEEARLDARLIRANSSLCAGNSESYVCTRLTQPPGTSPCLVRLDHRLYAVAQTELHHDSADMPLHRGLELVQLSCNFGVVSPAPALQHSGLARSQTQVLSKIKGD